MALMPPWMETASQFIGLREKPGAGNNPTILNWAKIVGGWTANYYQRDSIPWCGLFVAICLIQNAIKPPPDALRAKAWAKWSGGKRLREPCFGCILVFTRRGGGHVGFYVSEDKYYFHVLGGNQSDAVNVKKVSKKRHIASVWPKGKEFEKFYKKGRIYKKISGRVSVNEA